MTSQANTIKFGNIYHIVTDAIRRFINYIKELFTLEEVEVTFTKVGDSTRYSYRKVDHKHVA